MLALLSSQLDSATKTANATSAAFQSRRFNNNGTTPEDRIDALFLQNKNFKNNIRNFHRFYMNTFKQLIAKDG